MGRVEPALRLAVSSGRCVSPLQFSGTAPEGLASQPTLSRLLAMLSADDNREVVRECQLTCAARRLKAMRQGHRSRYLALDISSLPVPVHGHQPQSEHNGHYHARICHPLIALCTETRDLLGARLRPGAVHAADGADDFIVMPTSRAFVVHVYRCDTCLPKYVQPVNLSSGGSFRSTRDDPENRPNCRASH